MNNIAKFLFLGTGASAGVPVIGCKCAVCLSKVPYNQRLRPAGLIKIRDRNFLIDVGPDFRMQAINYKIDTLDGLILTHTHYDHIAGVDELRIYYLRSGKALACLLSEESFEELRRRYHYLFQPIGEVPTLSAQLEFHLLPNDVGSLEFQSVKIDYMSYFQGGTKVNGFRLGQFAYVSDIKEYDPSVFLSLRGVKTLVLSALREEPSPLHLSLDEAVAFARKVGAEQTYLTHLSHDVDHEAWNVKLPKSIQLGFDGMELEFEYI